MMIFKTPSKGVRLKGSDSFFFLSIAVLLGLLLPGCTLFSSRPVQDMSETAAALRAAKEVQADVLAPELFRQASDSFFKAKREYKFKNFNFAIIYAQKARRLAEEAEFEALRSGGNRTNDQVQDPLANNADGINPPNTNPADQPERSLIPKHLPPIGEPAPQGTPVEVYEQRKAEEDAVRQKMDQEASAPEGGPATPGGATPPGGKGQTGKPPTGVAPANVEVPAPAAVPGPG